MKTIETIPQQNSDIPVLSVLAGLRFFFAMWVLFAHTYNFGLHSRAMPVFSQSGLIAVVCFFAISGYSIHYSIASQPEGYYRRRFWRIFPVHITAVTMALLDYAVFRQVFDGHGREYPLPGALLWIQYYFLIQVFFYPRYIDVLFPLWSLSIEIMYYAVAPLVRKLGVNSLLMFIAASCALIFLWHVLGLKDIAGSPWGFQLVAFGWAWLTGWIAYMNPRNRTAAALSIVTGFAFITTQPEAFWLVNKLSIISTYLAWLLTVLVLVFPPKLQLKARAVRALNYLGDVSFPLYLIHYPVLFALSSTVFRKHPEWNYGIVHVVVSLAAAVAVYHLIDKPVRRFAGIRRLARDRQAASAKPI
jgi:peptidoglycan/LPS O-acetylase OafA/YrhL